MADDAREEAAEPAAAAPPKTVVPRWAQVTVLVLGAVVFSGIEAAAAPVVVVFMVSSVIALILNPLVTVIASRLRVRRGLSVLLAYLGFFLVILAIGGLLANPVASQVRTIQNEVPQLGTRAAKSLDALQGWFDSHGLEVKIKEQGQTAVQVIQKQLVRSSGDIFSASQSVLQSAAEFSFSLILVFVISVYMLLYSESIGRVVRRWMPQGNGSLEDDYPTTVQRAVAGYVRGQLLFSFVMGFSAGLAMWLSGVVGLFPEGQTYAVFFGVFLGLMELVPFIGPILGAMPPILVALVNDPLDAVWVALIFVALQQIEGHVVAPQVFGHSLRINPLLVLFSLLLGASLYGIVGALLALPITAVIRETVIYLSRHVELEPWGSYALDSRGQAGPDGGG